MMDCKHMHLRVVKWHAFLFWAKIYLRLKKENFGGYIKASHSTEPTQTSTDPMHTAHSRQAVAHAQYRRNKAVDILQRAWRGRFRFCTTRRIMQRYLDLKLTMEQTACME